MAIPNGSHEEAFNEIVHESLCSIKGASPMEPKQTVVGISIVLFLGQSPEFNL